MSDNNTDAAPRGALPAWAIPLGVIALIVVAFFFRAAPLTLDPVRQANAAEQFDTSRAIGRLARILGDETPHPVDSDALDITRVRLLEEIRALGYTPEVTGQTACRSSISGASIRCARVQNIMFSAGPATGPALVLAAHYDSVEAAPGAGDDGIGIAVWLEVAQHLRDTPPERPVLFLFTDGEETALLGAQAFVDAKAYGREIWRFINLEARGVTGPAMMFETSRPNSAVVTDWSKSGARPFSNSMMTAVYELLPNSTDLSVWLAAGHPGINIAISDGSAFYHTRRDDLAMLDHRSVQHMGDQALGAVRAFLASGDKPAGEIIYADILSRGFFSLPQGFGLLLLGLCTAMAATLLLSPEKGAGWRKLDWRALVLPPAVMIAAGVLAWLALMLLSLLRPTPAFWTAHPAWLNLVYFLCAMIATIAALGWLTPKSGRTVLFASGWFWFLAAGVGLSIAVPGMASLFLLPGLVFVVCAAAARLLPAPLWLMQAIPALALAAVFFPLLHLLDVTMGLTLAPAFGVVGGLTLAAMASLIGALPTTRLVATGAVGAALLAAAAAALTAPAYSVDRPLALNVVTHVDGDTSAAHLIASAPPSALPEEMHDALPDMLEDVVPGFTLPVRGRALELRSAPAIGWRIESDATENGVRTLALVPSASDARLIRLRIPAEYKPVRVHLDGAPNPVIMKDNAVVFDCVGRACDGRRVTISLDVSQPQAEDMPPWIIQGYWTALPREALSVQELRPETALPVQMGDITITTRRIADAALRIADEGVLDEAATPH